MAFSDALTIIEENWLRFMQNIRSMDQLHNLGVWQAGYLLVSKLLCKCRLSAKSMIAIMLVYNKRINKSISEEGSWVGREA